MFAYVWPVKLHRQGGQRLLCIGRFVWLVWGIHHEDDHYGGPWDEIPSYRRLLVHVGRFHATMDWRITD